MSLEGMGSIARLIVEISDYRIQVAMHVAAITIIFYDWLLSLSDEIKYIWRANLSGIKLAFLLIRYILPIDVLFAAYIWSTSATWLTASSCKVVIIIDTFVILTFFSALHYVVSVRTWTLWGRQGPIGVIIWGACLADLGVTYWLTITVLMSMQFEPNQFHICIGSQSSQLWMTWLPSMVFESFIFVLTAIKARQHKRQRVGNTLLSVFYRDGFMYFFFIVADSMVNAMVWAMGRPTQALVFRYFSAAICQAAGSHLILDLLSAAATVKPVDRALESIIDASNRDLTTVDHLTDLYDTKSPRLFTMFTSADMSRQFDFINSSVA